MAEPILEANNIFKSIDRKTILKEISFKIMPGSITAYLGPNGSGKTTTFKVISGLSPYDSGEIILNSKYYKKKSDIQFVFDEPVLYEELTGLEHIYFICEINKHRLKQGEIDELVKSFEVEEYYKTAICTYSLGMKKKIQLMCSMILKPRIILLDEYISGLDPIGLFAVKKIFKEYVTKGNAIVLATHMLDVAETFCDRAIILNEGQVLKEEDDLSYIKSEYKSLENYFVSSVLGNKKCKSDSIA